MKTTTRIYDIVKIELIKKGYSEIIEPYETGDYMQLLMPSNDSHFMRKIISYDDDVKDIIDNTVFNGYHLKNSDFDNRFKKLFINRFVDREIAYQTFDLFTIKLNELMLTYEDYLNALIENYDNFYKYNEINDSTSENNSTGETNGGYNNALQDLPQDKVNLDLSSNTMEYANNNTINRDFSNSNNNSTGNTHNNSLKYDYSNLEKMKGVINDVFIEIDKRCFLQIW